MSLNADIRIPIIKLRKIHGNPVLQVHFWNISTHRYETVRHYFSYCSHPKIIKFWFLQVSYWIPMGVAFRMDLELAPYHVVLKLSHVKNMTNWLKKTKSILLQEGRLENTRFVLRMLQRLIVWFQVGLWHERKNELSYHMINIQANKTYSRNHLLLL